MILEKIMHLKKLCLLFNMVLYICHDCCKGQFFSINCIPSILIFTLEFRQCYIMYSSSFFPMFY